jgi:signal transduction histidine kinase
MTVKNAALPPELSEIDAAFLAEDVSPALNQIVANNIRPTARGLAVLYLIFAISHILLLPEGVKFTMTAVALGTAVILAIVSQTNRYKTVSLHYAHPVAVGIALLILINSLLHLYLIPEAHLTTNISLLIVGIGVFFLSARWLVFTLILSLGGWLIVTGSMLGSPDWIHFLFLQVGSTFVAVIAHTVRIRDARRIAWLHLQEKSRREDLRQTAYEAQQRAAELKEAKEIAESANQIKTIFLNKVSHELRTPLAIIIGYAEFLQEKDEGTNSCELHAIEHAGHELLDKVNDLIDLSSLEAGQMVINHSTFQPVELIDGILYNAQLLMLANHNVFRTEFADNIGLMVSDAAKIQKILLNLLDNAAKFTRNGEVVLRVARVTAVTNSNDTIQFQITDTGIGIPTEDMPHLFETFRQGSNSPTQRYGGTGIGLALAKRYCLLLGGNIHIKSNINQGTTITVDLPAHLENTHHNIETPVLNEAVTS